MRKTLLLTAAVAALGLTSASAQVYSVNVVGFVNVNLVPGFNLVANPLKATNDTIGAIIPTAPFGTAAAKWDAAHQTFLNSVTFLGDAWDDPTYPIAPGEAIFVNSPEAATITFVGEVRQGSLATPLVPGFNFVGSQVPQSGGLTTTLGFSPDFGDTAAKWDAAHQRYFDAATFLGDSWDAEPTLGIAEGVVVNRSAAGNWTRSFTVQ